MRRHLQLGHSDFTLEPGPGGWFVHECWTTMSRDPRSRDEHEDWFGPYTHQGAAERLAELEADRGRRVA